MANINPIDFVYQNGEVKYDSFRLNFCTDGLKVAEDQLRERIEDAGLTDARFYGTVTIRDDGAPPQISVSDNRIEDFYPELPDHDCDEYTEWRWDRTSPLDDGRILRVPGHCTECDTSRLRFYKQREETEN